ncbi:MAG: hypothetical protein UZ19_OD1000378 [Parcubacteria bacterium OLB19]|nr:MAG: hypothetical protein UZ19_OD1000378 [Parcubacteria bacterium OLB19]
MIQFRYLLFYILQNNNFKFIKPNYIYQMNNSLRFYKTLSFVLTSALILIASAFFFYGSSELTSAASLKKPTEKPTVAATPVSNSFEPRMSCGSVLTTYNESSDKKTTINLLNGCGVSALSGEMGSSLAFYDQKMGVTTNLTRTFGGLSKWGEKHCVITDISTQSTQTKVLYTCYADDIN